MKQGWRNGGVVVFSLLFHAAFWSLIGCLLANYTFHQQDTYVRFFASPKLKTLIQTGLSRRLALHRVRKIDPALYTTLRMLLHREIVQPILKQAGRAWMDVLQGRSRTFSPTIDIAPARRRLRTTLLRLIRDSGRLDKELLPLAEKRLDLELARLPERIQLLDWIRIPGPLRRSLTEAGLLLATLRARTLPLVGLVLLVLLGALAMGGKPFSLCYWNGFLLAVPGFTLFLLAALFGHQLEVLGRNLLVYAGVGSPEFLLLARMLIRRLLQGVLWCGLIITVLGWVPLLLRLGKASRRSGAARTITSFRPGAG